MKIAIKLTKYSKDLKYSDRTPGCSIFIIPSYFLIKSKTKIKRLFLDTTIFEPLTRRELN